MVSEEMKVPKHSSFISQFCFKAARTEDNTYLQMQVIDLVLREKKKERLESVWPSQCPRINHRFSFQQKLYWHISSFFFLSPKGSGSDPKSPSGAHFHDWLKNSTRTSKWWSKRIWFGDRDEWQVWRILIQFLGNLKRGPGGAGGMRMGRRDQQCAVIGVFVGKRV